MRNLIEAVLDLDRIRNDDGNSRRPPRLPKGEGNGPKEGCFWHKGGVLMPVAMKTNEIVNPAGQAVLLDPEAYDLTSKQIMSWLGVDATSTPSRRESTDYHDYLKGYHKSFDPTRDALFWEASKIVFVKMLEMGWGWIIYDPPSRIHFTVMEKFAKRVITTAADMLPLMQIDGIKVTLVNDFSGFLSAKYPHLSKNKTLTFSSKDIQGFGGNFGAALDWTSGKEAPESNYLYTVVSEVRSLSANKMNVQTKDGYRQRWGIRFSSKPIENVPEGRILIRVPTSITNRGMGRAHWKCGLTEPNTKGERTLFSDTYFSIEKKDIEVFINGKWT